MDKQALEYVLEKARMDDVSITQEQGRQSLGALGLSGEMALARIGKHLHEGQHYRGSLPALHQTERKPCCAKCAFAVCRLENCAFSDRMCICSERSCWYQANSQVSS